MYVKDTYTYAYKHMHTYTHTYTHGGEEEESAVERMATDQGQRTNDFDRQC